MLTIALSKGKMLELTLDVFRRAGYALGGVSTEQSLDRLGLLHVSGGLPPRQAKRIRQHVRGLRDRATLGKQIECSVQALGPLGAGGSRHWP